LRRVAEQRLAAGAAVFAAVLGWPRAAAAQPEPAPAPRFEEAPLPPRIDEVTPSERARAREPAPAAADTPPNRARLAPLPEDRAEPIDEIVVTAEEPWRQLPDLGSDWRAQREAELERRRYVFSLFPRDAAPVRPRYDDPFLVNPDGVPEGEITFFRYRFGRRRDSDESSNDGEDAP
jgi:hypothetical protein